MPRAVRPGRSAAATWWATAPIPTRSCDWVRENCAVVVRGNHDRASTGQDDLEWFNPVARSGRGLDAGAI